MNKQYYYAVNAATGEVSQTAIKALTRGGVAHIPANALRAKPLPVKAGFVVIAKADLSGTEYKLDNRGKAIYSKSDATKSKLPIDFGEIDSGWTFEKPLTRFDKWKTDKWATDKQAQFEDAVLQVDTTRRELYQLMCDPLVAESLKNRLRGRVEAAKSLEDQALAADDKIKAENPWPTPVY